MSVRALNLVSRIYPQVKKIVDATKEVEIAVTTADIKGSKRKQFHDCAMARACEREHDGAIISVGIAYLIDGNKAVRYLTSPQLKKEIISFDRAHYFEPGVYRLIPPFKGQKLGAKRKPTSREGKHTGERILHRYRAPGVRTLAAV